MLKPVNAQPVPRSGESLASARKKEIAERVDIRKHSLLCTPFGVRLPVQRRPQCFRVAALGYCQSNKSTTNWDLPRPSRAPDVSYKRL